MSCLICTYQILFLFVLDIDNCIGIDCLNDGSCLDFPEYYICKCAQGFEGNHCEAGF